MAEKSILEQALLQIETLEEAVKANAKGIISSTMKKELSELLKESKEEEEDEFASDDESSIPDEEGKNDMASDDEESDDEEKELTLEDLRAYAIENGEPAKTSGKQEYFENIINRFI